MLSFFPDRVKIFQSVNKGVTIGDISRYRRVCESLLPNDERLNSEGAEVVWNIQRTHQSYMAKNRVEAQGKEDS